MERTLECLGPSYLLIGRAQPTLPPDTMFAN